MLVYSQEVEAMKGIYLVNYSVKGIKSLDEDVALSFYKKTLTSSSSSFLGNMFS